jgi:aerobic carbon-monoxide dehydrogenase medium subunit
VKLCRKSGEFADTLAVAIADARRGHCSVVLGAVNGAPLVLDDTSQLLANGEHRVLREAVTDDLDRAADRHFDEFQRNLHAVAAMRAVHQVLQ